MAHTFELDHLKFQSEHIQSHVRLLFVASDGPTRDCPDRVYYPCCGDDASPSFAFPHAVVTYVDQREEAIRALQEQGLNAHVGQAETFCLEEEQDLVILINPNGFHRNMVNRIRIGGHVYCNGSHETAYDIQQLPDFLLVAVLQTDQNRMTCAESRDLDLYWQHVETDEEYREADKSERLRQFLHKYAGIERDFVSAHQALLETAFQRTSEHFRQMSIAHPNMGFNGVVTRDESLYLNPQDFGSLVPPIPFKRYSGLYIFERVMRIL